MMKRFLQTLLILITAFFILNCFAGSIEQQHAKVPVVSKGAYFNFSGGYSGVFGGFNKSAFSWSSAVGYQFSPYVALEFGFLNIPSVSLTDSNGNSTRAFLGIFNLMVKGIYPVFNWFDVFLKAGFGYSYVSASQPLVGLGNSGHFPLPMMGFGWDLDITQHTALTMQLIYNFQDNDHFPDTFNGLFGITVRI